MLATNWYIKCLFESINLAEEQILGTGQFGVVRKGRFKNQFVAVKSCKAGAGIEQFKEFLKEIKVLAFVGEHESIVYFHGAFAEICYAVVELSPFGNLHSYLKRYSSECPVTSKRNLAYRYRVSRYHFYCISASSM